MRNKGNHAVGLLPAIAVPDHQELFETAISTHWFDECGILCAVSKEADRTINHYQEIMNLYASLTRRGERLCLLSDATRSTKPMDKQVREFVTREMPRYIKAHGIISQSHMGSTQSIIFLKLSFSGYPIQLFPSEHEAREWLKQFL